MDRVADALAAIGVGLVLPNGADKAAKYANAIMLVRDHGYSVTRAAREAGVSSSHLTRKIDGLGAKGDPSVTAEAADRRILEISQTMSALAGERLIERLEQDGDTLKTTELTKLYKSSSNLVEPPRLSRRLF